MTLQDSSSHTCHALLSGRELAQELASDSLSREGDSQLPCCTMAVAHRCSGQ